MKLKFDMHRIRIIPLVLCIACLQLASSCRDSSYVEVPFEDEGCDFFFTKAGGTGSAQFRTFRVNQMFNGVNKEPYELLADGAYCDVIDEEKGWLYPCKVDTLGNALDQDGNVIPLDDADWFEKTVNLTRYGLRMRPLEKESYTTLVVCSPARRMQRFPVSAQLKDQRWGYKLRYDEDFQISDPIEGIPFTTTFLENRYIYNKPIVLSDKRARINVVVACGALSKATLHAAHFQNAMTSVWYQPKEKNFYCPQMDGGAKPFETYTQNSYPESGNHTVSGNMLLVTEGDDDIHLEQRPGKTGPFTEWSKDVNCGTCVTAIRQFPVFALDYSRMEGDTYVYEDLIPDIVVYSGKDGAARSTVRLAADIHEMVEYTVVIYLSTAYVSARLVVGPWDYDDVSFDFSDSRILPVTTECLISPWIDNPVIPDEDGTITNS